LSWSPAGTRELPHVSSGSKQSTISLLCIEWGKVYIEVTEVKHDRERQNRVEAAQFGSNFNLWKKWRETPISYHE
jgi:hypothetical protein